MVKYQDIIEAKELLDLPERASMDDIKAQYRKLVGYWHPDRGNDDEAACNEMTSRLNAAYRTILLYCDQYRYSFAREEIEHYLSEEDWWTERFGNDPLWGKAGKP
ncbi:MAG: J domain-containing protein [Deltaproteobacteria bacterium]|nr:J domain-containing protein [Deltaproteobacteria bacterium]